MTTIAPSLLMLGFLATGNPANHPTPLHARRAHRAADDATDNKNAKEKRPTPKFPLGKETTYVDGPLDNDGYIDYESALNERLSKGIKPENNANVLLWKALGPKPEGGNGMPPKFFRWLGIEEPPERGEYFIGLFRFSRDHLKLEPGEATEAINDEQSRASQRPWTANEHPEIARWLQLNEKPLAVAIEASKRPEYFNPLVSGRTEKERTGLISALLPGVQKCRELAAALTARAMLRAGEGKFDEAWQDLLACHRLGRLLSRGATLIETLVGIAVDAIASNTELALLERAKPTAKQAQAWLRDLQALPPMSPMADKIDLAERFMFLDSVVLLRRGNAGMLQGLAGDGPPFKKPDPKARQALESLDWEPVLRNGNGWYDRIVAAMHNKDRVAREKAFDQIDEELKALKNVGTDPTDVLLALQQGRDPGKQVSEKIGHVLIGLFMPAARKVQGAAYRTEQIQRNLHLAFALAAYKADHGAYPPKLADLAPKYLPKVPDDIFSGKALIYRPSENGYLLYSVGANGKDEGGRWFDDDPPGDDPSVRMPLPELKKK
jgi:hypothetical protein